MKNTLTAFIAYVCLASTAMAYDFCEPNSDGKMLYYNILSAKDMTCELTYSTDTHNTGREISGAVVIPSWVLHDGSRYYVTEIGTAAFRECCEITAVSVPESVTKIGSTAFAYCSSLSAMTLPDGLTEMGWSCFSDCTALAEATIPVGVKTVANYAFRDCTSLKTITFDAADCTTVGSSTSAAFPGCLAIEQINIGANVRRIPAHAFRNTTSASLSQVRTVRVAVPDPADIALTASAFAVTPLEKCTLHVPAGSKNLYAAAEVWCNFAKIIDGTESVPGDINGDNTVDSSDLAALINIITGAATPMDAADINGDEAIDSSDLAALINIITGL